MTIDEAITHAREEAKMKMAEYENHYDKDGHYYPRQCKRYAEQQEQLADWLEELKAFQENKWTDIYIKRGYNKAIDDFSNALADDLTWLKKLGDEVYDDVGIDVRMRAEQLKAGGENGD